MAPEPDDRWAALAKSDPRAAAEALIRQHAQDGYRLAYRLLGDREDALDAVQEACVRVLRRIGTWRGQGSARAWMMRIVSNEAFRQRRARRRDAVAGGPASLAPGDPADEAVQRERNDAVRTALDALPAAQRETVTLRHFAGLSLAEIAAVRGCALGTVKATLFQAYHTLHGSIPPEIRPEGW